MKRICHRRASVASVVVLLGVNGCERHSAPPTQAPSGTAAPVSDSRAPTDTGASDGVTTPALAELLDDHWQAQLKDAPTWATRLGVHAYDDRLADESADAVERRRAERDRFEARALAMRPSVRGPDAETLELLIASLQSARARDVCQDETWNIGVQRNPVSMIVQLHEGFVLANADDVDNLEARVRATDTLVAQRMAALQRGLAKGLVANRASLQRLVALIDRQLAEPAPRWALATPAGAQGWEPAARREANTRITAAVVEVAAPAIKAFRRFVVDSLLPKARGPGSPGIGALPIGSACYAAQIQHHTTTSLTAKQVHDIGLAEIARIDKELATLGARALGTAELAATLATLRSDETLYFQTAEEVEAAAVAGLAAAKTAMPMFFNVLPQADCIVRRVPDFEAPHTHIGYYNQPNPDGSKPGEYFINVFAPHTRPRFEAAVLAVHESIPGHHLQTAIAQELQAMPAFRRHGGYSAFVEGWALYTERMADEMGLYPTDLDRIGVASFDAWRAGRLVVDTGLHAMGWTRAQAEAFLLAHTALTPANIANEVDRYIGWPGQALGYKIGQRHILQLRARAEARLGERFELARFHDAILGAGPVTLPVLSRRIDAWIETQPGAQPGSQ